MSSQKLTALIVGATRGLGASLASKYASKNYTVYGTARGKPGDSLPNVNWINNVDVGSESAGRNITNAVTEKKLDVVVVVSGYMATESLDKPDFEQEVQMYKICSIGPVFIIHHLYKAGLLQKGSKVLIISSEGGSITLRHESEGGGMYGHHGSKAATNMIGKLLSLDFKEKEVPIGLIHPGFMRTELTKSVGFEKYYEAGGAVTPDVAADKLIEFIDTFDMSMTGKLWATRGPDDIGTVEQTIGPKKDLPTPFQIPW